jgi:cold shock CspA family protein
MFGKVLWFDPLRGFGFIKTDSGETFFVHHSQVPGQPGRKTLEKFAPVEFEVGQFNGKTVALNVRPVARSNGAA